MSDQIYRALADTLHKIPNAYPPTASGVEIKILRRLFTEEEALLASQMRLRFENAKEIAARAAQDDKEATRHLKKMVRRGLIRIKKGEGELLFSLMPFVVGFYENQLPNLDVELADMVEDYFSEIAGKGLLDTTPAVHRVIPVEESIPFDLEIFPHERASELLENAKAWAVRDCICRVQQHLLDQGCEHPVESCLVFAPVEGAFDNSKVDRALTKEEAFEILQLAEESGLVHSAANHKYGHSYICNCCTCCCGVLRGVAEFDIPTAIARSDIRASIDEMICSGCEDCLPRCQFNALSVNGTCEVDAIRCVGCGLCIQECSTGALTLIRRDPEEIDAAPENFKDWMIQRAETRGINLEEIT
jgi:ferredoxin